MNSRGLMKLMAIVTTMMAGPLFEFFYRRAGRRSGELAALDDAFPKVV